MAGAAAADTWLHAPSYSVSQLVFPSNHGGRACPLHGVTPCTMWCMRKLPFKVSRLPIDHQGMEAALSASGYNAFLPKRYMRMAHPPPIVGLLRMPRRCELSPPYGQLYVYQLSESVL